MEPLAELEHPHAERRISRLDQIIFRLGGDTGDVVRASAGERVCGAFHLGARGSVFGVGGDRQKITVAAGAGRQAKNNVAAVAAVVLALTVVEAVVFVFGTARKGLGIRLG